MPSLISITFDDGLRCQFEKALPILDHHSLKATFFLPRIRTQTTIAGPATPMIGGRLIGATMTFGCFAQ
ncbi:MAG TPA: polysaccharide deacetylase family protein [Candidatus Sulfotelmatobacter sp.]|nr:polysaccharide deacetylase family protein [Candidatus Sulfotelmatobacter sp.]